eukprot:39315-Rhodomonas_salina.1
MFGSCTVPSTDISHAATRNQDPSMWLPGAVQITQLQQPHPVPTMLLPHALATRCPELSQRTAAPGAH